jgi:hypothetical protein
MTARAANGKGFFLAAKGGHNAESHNHNDVGQFIVCYNGFPVIIDVGVERYTAKTFSSRRYEIWTMRSEFHNLPVINGISQKEGREFKARNTMSVDYDGQAVFSADIAKAYPIEAGVEAWERKCVLLREKDSGSVAITDSYSLYETGGEIIHNFMFADEPKYLSPGAYTVVLLNGTPLTVSFSNKKLDFEIKKIEIKDGKLSSIWGKAVWRLKIKEKLNMCKCGMSVLVINGEV